MKFIQNYRTELSTFLLVPIHAPTLVPIGALRWYRFVRYSGTDSCAMMVPFRRYYHSYRKIKIFRNHKMVYGNYSQEGIEFWREGYLY